MNVIQFMFRNYLWNILYEQIPRYKLNQLYMFIFFVPCFLIFSILNYIFSLVQPNGRFETNKKICLSISGHHPELWRPSWSIRTALLAIVGYMPSSGLGTLASLQYTPEERKILAKRCLFIYFCSFGKYISLASIHQFVRTVFGI